MKAKAWCPYISKNVKDIIHVFDPIYRKNFFVIVGVSEQRFLDIMKKQLDVTFEKKDNYGKFHVLARTKSPDIGLIWSKDSGEFLVHECLHATAWALDHVGINLSPETDEVYAYYQQFLVKAIKEAKDDR